MHVRTFAVGKEVQASSELGSHISGHVILITNTIVCVTLQPECVSVHHVTN